MTTYADDRLNRDLEKRTEQEARGETIDSELETDKLSDHYQKSTVEIMERLRPAAQRQ